MRPCAIKWGRTWLTRKEGEELVQQGWPHEGRSEVGSRRWGHLEPGRPGKSLRACCGHRSTEHSGGWQAGRHMPGVGGPEARAG